MSTANSDMPHIIPWVELGGRGTVNTYINILTIITCVTVILSLSSQPTMVEKSC